MSIQQNSIEKFFHIPVLKNFPGGTKQVEAFGKMLDEKKRESEPLPYKRVCLS